MTRCAAHDANPTTTVWPEVEDVSLSRVPAAIRYPWESLDEYMLRGVVVVILLERGFALQPPPLNQSTSHRFHLVQITE